MTEGNAQEGSFITEAPGQQPEVLPDMGAERARLDDDYEKNMEVPREQASKLREVVLNLNEKMNALLEQEKAEFLAAYRAHTKKIQEDLTRLRARVAEEEASFRKDEKVRQLQGDRDRFRSDALVLDAQTLAMKKQLVEMKTNLEVLEDDRNFLVRQLRRAKQNNDAVRAELTGESGGWGNEGGAATPDEQAQRRNCADSGSEGDDLKSASSMSTTELLDNLKASINRTEEHLPQLVARNGCGSSGGGGGELPFDSTAWASALEPFGGLMTIADRGTKGGSAVDGCSSGGYENRVVNGLRRELRGVSAAVSVERKQKETLSRAVAELAQRRETHWLEALLLDCVRQVLGEIEFRRRPSGGIGGDSKRKAGAGGGGLGGDSSFEGSATEARRAHQQPSAGTASQVGVGSLSLDRWGEAPLHLDWFTAPDRVSALNLLQQDRRVRVALSARLARSAAAAQREAQREASDIAHRVVGRSAGFLAGELRGVEGVSGPPEIDLAAETGLMVVEQYAQSTEGSVMDKRDSLNSPLAPPTVALRLALEKELPPEPKAPKVSRISVPVNRKDKR